MTVLDYILNGIEAELALERELGVRYISLTQPLPPTPTPLSPLSTLHSPLSTLNSQLSPYPFVFLHDRALSPDAITMMAKIVGALKATPETAPILFTGEKPSAKVYIVLGSQALKKWFPGERGVPGEWVTPEQNVLITYSPEYILRFGVVTPKVMALKREMWNSLKSVAEKVRAS